MGKIKQKRGVGGHRSKSGDSPRVDVPPVVVRNNPKHKEDFEQLLDDAALASVRLAKKAR